MVVEAVEQAYDPVAGEGLLSFGFALGHTCKKREIAEIYLRKFFWIFRKILG